VSAETKTSEAGSDHAAGGSSDLALYRRMRLIRVFEDQVQALFQKGEVHGTTHLCSGQEASAVGVCDHLRRSDRVCGTYRGHGHALAMGVTPQALMEELLGRAGGICGGRAGSMNVVDLEHGLLGCFGIVGGSIGAATGAGLALKRAGAGDVAVAFFGDGASNQGYFAECLNFAQVEQLPVVFVCENNLYMEFTPIEQVTAGSIASRPTALGIPTQTVDGNNVWVVHEAAGEAVERARAGNGPSFIETLTYRFVGHSRSDPGDYRKPGELEEWRKRDPLLQARERMIRSGSSSPEEVDVADAAVAEELERVVATALAAPFPDEGAGAEFK
jgi:TPP-dependent pyruvate/acetoin dehydrogenase alpha subunit